MPPRLALALALGIVLPPCLALALALDLVLPPCLALDLALDNHIFATIPWLALDPQAPAATKRLSIYLSIYISIYLSK